MIPRSKRAWSPEYKKGPLGFPVIDISVSCTDGSYHSVNSSDLAFRTAARIGVEALPQCQPVLLEPIHVVEIVCPNDATAKINAILSAQRPDPGLQHHDNWPGWDFLRATMPEAEIGDLVADAPRPPPAPAAPAVRPHGRAPARRRPDHRRAPRRGVRYTGIMPLEPGGMIPGRPVTPVDLSLKMKRLTQWLDGQRRPPLTTRNTRQTMTTSRYRVSPFFFFFFFFFVFVFFGGAFFFLHVFCSTTKFRLALVKMMPSPTVHAGAGARLVERDRLPPITVEAAVAAHLDDLLGVRRRGARIGQRPPKLWPSMVFSTTPCRVDGGSMPISSTASGARR